MKTTEFKIWMNGKLVPQAEAVLPVNSAAVFYASNVFEGIRAYWNEADGELYAFRLAEHFARFRESMKMMRFTIPYQDLDLYEAVRQVLTGNEAREDIHMHLVAYVGGPGLEATSPTGMYINPRRRPRIGDGNGLTCCISSWQRTSDNAIPIRLKCGANYQNGRLAALQAKADGYDSPIFLNQRGTVAEGTGATFFMVRKGKLVTPPVTSDILESITRSTLIESPPPASAWTSWSGTSRGPSSTWRTRLSSAAAATRSRPSCPWTASRSATASSGPSPSACSTPT
jgi:branched-chain amino acid aminotransferase